VGGQGIGAWSECGRRKKKKTRERTFLFRRKLGGGEVVCGRARVELSPKVEDVVFGEACGRKAVKAA
jgi:hypothetical protein